jgi:Protein of unknown function (DUF2750)
MLRYVSQSAAHAATWRRDVRAHRELWTVEDDTGIPAPPNREGRRAMPFWSTRGRAEKVIASVPAYHDFRAISLSLEAFESQWLDNLERDGLLVGINWSGDTATGYDVEPDEVRAWLAAE